jgi:hypothetical protein
VVLGYSVESDCGGAVRPLPGRGTFGSGRADPVADHCGNFCRLISPAARLPRFTFFLDISMSFFEEVAKFRAGRRIWAELARERFGARTTGRGISGSTARLPASISRASSC